MKISIVIPARDSGRYVGELLAALMRQTRLPDEIVVVDAGSADDTAARVAGFAGGSGIIKLQSIGPAYPGKARNSGAAASTGDLILMTDSDTLPDERWIERLTAPFDSPAPPDVVFGTYTVAPENYLQRCMSFSILARGRMESGRRICTDSFASVAFSRKAWELAGGFPENIRAGEDLMLMRRLRAMGLKLEYSFQASVLWRLPESLWPLLKRTWEYTGSRTFGGYSSSYDVKVAAFYAAMAVLFWFFPRAAAGLLALVLFIRVPRTVLAAGPGGGGFLLSPANWILLAGFYFLVDVAHASGWICGSLRRALPGRRDA